MKDGEVDKTELCKMIDAFIAAGFNYFDTAHGYLRGKSEVAVRECLTSRYPRDAYLLADKLTSGYFSCEADIRPFFESQLDICGVEYFDFYLMHAQNKEFFEKYNLINNCSLSTLYESLINEEKEFLAVKEKMQKDNVKVIKLYGKNGEISKKECAYL